MVKTWFIGAVVAAVLALGVGRAEACGGGYGGENDGAIAALVIVGASFAVSDVVFPIYDVAAWDTPSRGMGIFEAVMMAPQAAIGGLALGATIGADEFNPGSDAGDRFLLVWTGLTSACFVHGVWAASHHEPPRMELGPASGVALAPILAPGQGGMAGLGVSGLF